MTFDEKWKIVKEYFETHYKDVDGKRIKFKSRLPDDKINEFYFKILKLSRELSDLPSHRQTKILQFKKGKA